MCSHCTKCNAPIVLKPSAAERVRKYGNTVSYYLNLFTICSSCQTKSWYEGTKK